MRPGSARSSRRLWAETSESSVTNHARVILELDTPHGLARAHLRPVESPVAGLVLGHGAGGGIGSPDLVGAAEAARSAGLSVALVEQPYRVAGRRSPAPASQLDAAWTSVVRSYGRVRFSGLPILTGGRSSGARVACRTAAETHSVAVVCLAFPLHPPGRPRRAGLRSSTASPSRRSSSRARATLSGCRRQARTAPSSASPGLTR